MPRTCSSAAIAAATPSIRTVAASACRSCAACAASTAGRCGWCRAKSAAWWPRCASTSTRARPAEAGRERVARRLRGQWLQPAVGVGRGAVEQSEEQLLQAQRHRAGLAGADLAAVDRADRGDLGGGAAHEQLVAQVQVLARQVAFDHLDAGVARQADYRIAGDYGAQRRAYWR